MLRLSHTCTSIMSVYTTSSTCLITFSVCFSVLSYRILVSIDRVMESLVLIHRLTVMFSEKYNRYIVVVRSSNLLIWYPSRLVGMARMQNVDSQALKKPILSGSGGSGSNNGGATGTTTHTTSTSATTAMEIHTEEDSELMEERADRKKTNWRLLGLGKLCYFWWKCFCSILLLLSPDNYVLHSQTQSAYEQFVRCMLC